MRQSASVHFDYYNLYGCPLVWNKGPDVKKLIETEALPALPGSWVGSLSKSERMVDSLRRMTRCFAGSSDWYCGWVMTAAWVILNDSSCDTLKPCASQPHARRHHTGKLITFLCYKVYSSIKATIRRRQQQDQLADRIVRIQPTANYVNVMKGF